MDQAVRRLGESGARRIWLVSESKGGRVCIQIASYTGNLFPSERGTVTAAGLWTRDERKGEEWGVSGQKF